MAAIGGNTHVVSTGVDPLDLLLFCLFATVEMLGQGPGPGETCLAAVSARIHLDEEVDPVRTSAKLGLAALMSALLLANALSTASARFFSLSNQNIRVTWSRLEFDVPGTLRCRVTLEGSFHSTTFAKVRTLVGTVTRAAVNEAACTSGQLQLRNTPWPVAFDSFTGLLPTPTSIRLTFSRVLYRLTGTGFSCTYGTATDTLSFTATISLEREFTELRPVEGNRLNLLEGSIFSCRAQQSMASSGGEGLIRQLNTTTRIRVTLI